MVPSFATSASMAASRAGRFAFEKLLMLMFSPLTFANPISVRLILPSWLDNWLARTARASFTSFMRDWLYGTPELPSRPYAILPDVSTTRAML
ncbi:hypothetical protein D3C72_1388660 [compost metagenome]